MAGGAPRRPLGFLRRRRRDGLAGRDADSAGAELFAHALRYPFGRVAGSYALVGGEPIALPPRQLEALGDGGTAVLAYGANASPERLRAKLGRLERPASVPVIAAEVRDLDVVYSAHVSPYGSIPGTLQHSPGTTLQAHVLYLGPAELEAIDGTEPNYALARVEGIDARLGTGARLEAVHAYVSRHGCLVDGDTHVAVADIPATDRRFPEADEPRVLALARDRLAPKTALEDFVLEHIRDPAVARDRTRELKSDAEPFRWSRWEPVR